MFVHEMQNKFIYIYVCVCVCVCVCACVVTLFEGEDKVWPKAFYFLGKKLLNGS